ncbi:MAG: hypothetical protein A2048_04850 [Deltaproteobacteria bacterium GWA2_45_12]|nr:MAG: hypothetical protein A2048_04850 [Deltaproteobacteria bacterium GWA2_45_12]
MMQIKKVAVIGSGVMGAGIAAHLANAGIPSVLLDIVPKFTEEDAKAGLKETDARFRNKLALKSIEEVIGKSKPSLIFDKKDMKLICAGNTQDDLKLLGECDWIIEVVTERLDIKQKVFETVEKNMKKGAIISSNTSGIPLKTMAEGRSPEFRKNFVITHFFNPVRYMKLVEVVSSSETDKEVLSTVVDFLENTLGKGVVTAKDTPNFVANRIGVYAWMASLHEALSRGLSVEAVDKIAGAALGRPKSAAFRTADMVGLDTLVHVAKNTYDLCLQDESREAFKIPPILNTMIEKKLFGDKTKQGFYKKTKGPDGKKEILSINLKTGEYGPQEKVRYDSLGAIKNLEDLPEKIRTMVGAADPAGEFAWKQVSDTLVYAANRIPEIADDVVNVDNAMKWGFNWDLGPFETLDVLGVKNVADRLQKEGRAVPVIIKAVLEKGNGVFYKNDKGKKFFFDQRTNSYQPVPLKSTNIVIRTLKEQGRELKSNTGASLIDIGDGVLCVEFHTKMNAIDGDIGDMLNAGIDLMESSRDYAGLVIANDGGNFSAGANLMLLWLESQQKNWDNIEKLVKGFQDVCMRLKYSSKPTVAAPFGLTLGGGCEVSMGCDAIRAHGECYIGLVEVGAGLIPGGGGNKNVLLNVEAALKAKGAKGWAGPSDGGFFPKVQKTFETVAFAKVATSAKEAYGHNYFKRSDKISLSRDKLLYDAKQDVLEMAKTYQKTTPREDIYVGGEGAKMALLNGIEGFRAQGLISEHDGLIASKLAHVLTGGNLPNQGFVSEQYLLDVERETFLQLCGEEKSQARMQSLLMTGKPLRN